MTEPEEEFREPIELLENCDSVLGLVRRSGRCDAEDFIAALQGKFQARFQRHLEYLRDGNYIKNPENRRDLRETDDGLLVIELKVDKYRLYLIRADDVWFASHGREKPKDSQVPKEITKALEFYDEWKMRQDNGDLQDQ